MGSPRARRRGRALASGTTPSLRGDSCTPLSSTTTALWPGSPLMAHALSRIACGSYQRMCTLLDDQMTGKSELGVSLLSTGRILRLLLV